MQPESQQSPSPTSTPPRRWPRWAVLFGCWTLFGLFLYSHQYVLSTFREDESFDWGPVFILVFASTYLWAALTPAVLRLADRFPLRRENWLHVVPIHILAGAVLASIAISCHWLIARQVRPEQYDSLGNHIASYLHLDFQWYLAILGLGHAIDYYRRYRDRELRASNLENQLITAQLQALKMQLQPHFLFNTLNTISSFVHHNPDVAESMIARLSELLRHALDGAEAQEVALRDELQLLEPYLEIEQARFEDRLKVQWEIDPSTLDARVPHLLLQPLVENSIRHGISRRSAPGTVEIAAWRTNGKLNLEIRDDGAGDGNGSAASCRGVGLANTRARLEQLYGADHRFDLQVAPGRGARVSISLPFRRFDDYGTQPN